MDIEKSNQPNPEPEAAPKPAPPQDMVIPPAEKTTSEVGSLDKQEAPKLAPVVQKLIPPTEEKSLSSDKSVTDEKSSCLTQDSKTVKVKEKPTDDSDIHREKMNTNGMEIDTPKKEVDTPKKEVDISKNEMEIDTPKKEVDIPKKEMEADTPKKEVDVPKKKVDPPKEEVDIPRKEIDTPKEEMEIDTPKKAVDIDTEKETKKEAPQKETKKDTPEKETNEDSTEKKVDEKPLNDENESAETKADKEMPSKDEKESAQTEEKTPSNDEKEPPKTVEKTPSKDDKEEDSEEETPSKEKDEKEDSEEDEIEGDDIINGEMIETPHKIKRMLGDYLTTPKDKSRSSTGKRVRKSVERHSPGFFTSKPEKPAQKDASGRGKTLRDIESVKDSIQSRPRNDATLQAAHKFLFYGKGRASATSVVKMKQSLLDFSGYLLPDATAEEDQAIEVKYSVRAHKLKKDVLKKFCDLFNVNRGAVNGVTVGKDELVERLLNFLSVPNEELINAPKKTNVKASTKKRRKSSAPSPSSKKRKTSHTTSVKVEDSDDDDDDDDDGNDEEETKKEPTTDELRTWVKAYIACFNLEQASTKHAMKTVSDKFGMDLQHKKQLIKDLLAEAMS